MLITIIFFIDQADMHSRTEQRYIYIYRPTERHAGRQKQRETKKKTDRETETEKHTERHTERSRQSQRESDRGRYLQGQIWIAALPPYILPLFQPTNHITMHN